MKLYELQFQKDAEEEKKISTQETVIPKPVGTTEANPILNFDYSNKLYKLFYKFTSNRIFLCLNKWRFFTIFYRYFLNEFPGNEKSNDDDSVIFSSDEPIDKICISLN